MRRMAVAALALGTFWAFTTPAQAAGTVSLVSHVPNSAVSTPSGTSSGGFANAKGTKIAFASEAPAGDLVAGTTDNNGADQDVYLYDVKSQKVTLISHAAGQPAQTAGDEVFLAGISESGRFILLQSATNNLSATATLSDPGQDLYVYDTKSKKATLASHTAGLDEDSNGFAQSGFISEKKVKTKLFPMVVWETTATDVVPDFEDQNGTLLRDVYLYDGKSKKNILVSRDFADPNKGSASCGAFCPVANDFKLAKSGRYVVYNSDAHNLVPGFDDNNGDLADGGDVYVFDAKTKTHRLVSHAAGQFSVGSNGGSDSGTPTANGKFIAFRSAGTTFDGDFVDNNGSGNRDIWLYDLKTQGLELVSHEENAPSESTTGTNFAPSISDDGRYVTFAGAAVAEYGNFLDSNGTTFNSGMDAVQLDRETDLFALVSFTAGTPAQGGNGHSVPFGSTSDGRYVLVSSTATDLVTAFDNNNTTNGDFFLWDRKAAITHVVSRDATNAAGGSSGAAGSAGLARKAPRVPFSTDGGNHINGFDDNNGAGFDVFLYTLP